ncbi:hypothetical protein GCM10010441_64570 [Kitasatospora paracochleata]|uniref:Lipoprotein n=1 Tax=Kitasatospora paracochleata TaxID=58354 RepID=A0ABT1IU92_9ACTN|nr:hypothetical protein [Kitasatospora paracochleata]MCP2308707.1 hypothetical protein [Kitasatospora paracochleata]
MEEAVEVANQVTTDDGKRTPAHARSGLRHWALVAAGCAAVVGGALAATSATGSVIAGRPDLAPEPGPAASGGASTPGTATAPGAAGTPGTAKPTQASAAPDPAKAELPLDCGPFPVAVSLRTSASIGGVAATVAAVHCQADLGTPPDAVYLLVPGTAGKPKVAAVLVKDTENLTVTELAVRSDGSIHGRAKGYSSDDVPRFAPDLTLELNWAQKGGQWVRTETNTPTARA